MATRFDRPLYGFRFVETHFGDTLQDIAARELGDASLWVELINYNGLVPPFIVDDADFVRPGVVLSGTQIIVPAPTPALPTTTDPNQVFKTDIQLAKDGEPLTDGSDFVSVSGRANLRQSIKNRINTDRGELIFHASNYGCDIRRLVGVVNGPTGALLAARAVRTSLIEDDRISSVTFAKAQVSGDVVSVTVETETVAGKSSDQIAVPR